MKKKSLYINIFPLMCMTILLLFPPSLNAEPLDNWFTVTTASINDFFYGLAFGNNTFVAVGADGIILTSPDGIVWTPRNLLGYPNYFFAVTYGNGKFVAVGTGGTVLTSSTGQIWILRISRTTQFLYDTIYENSIFVDVGEYGTTL